MIGWLKGSLAEKGPDWVIVDTGGVGYLVSCSSFTASSLPESGNVVSFHIYTHVREDGITLFGFSTKPEKELFMKLIAVSDIGPKKALSILSGARVNDLVNAIRRGDMALLTSLQGVGKKTAERLILELRDKLHGMEDIKQEGKTQSPLRQELVEVLVSLGYRPAAAEKAVEAIKEQIQGGVKLEILVREALSEIKKLG